MRVMYIYIFQGNPSGKRLELDVCGLPRLVIAVDVVGAYQVFHVLTARLGKLGRGGEGEEGADK